ncbi:FAD-linked oxidase C-terminal domain-containing protein [Boseongicola sp. H5]|uniref:FAD-binding oxidoreductase n=1 Tax=Boseongicola sp. H5 TaxID=2763261 RepID=UPI001B19195F|nr:FAD-linked oxidase C-terminal domain-containing protein [Boseongicola sp. H5]MBO6921970.1 FAD-binding protein [Roseicyclus sp.]
MNAVTPANSEIADTLRDHLERRTGLTVETRPSALEQYAGGEGMPYRRVPDAMVAPSNTQDVSAVVRVAADLGAPVTCFGGGTSLEGQVVPVEGGLVIDTSRMSNVLEVSSEALDCRVQGGIRRKNLNAYLRDTGVFFPVDPGPDATIGGMVSTRASGTNAVRYGTMKENVLGLTVVLADGTVIRTGSRARKASVGYDLTSLFVGSEGTLGVITEVALKLVPRPSSIASGICQFDKLDKALAVVSQTLLLGLEPSRLELLDEVQTVACAAYSRLEELRDASTIFFEFAGNADDVSRRIKAFRDICAQNAGSEARRFDTAEAHSRYWTARERCYEAALSLAPGKKNMGTDACVPLDRLAECILRTKELIAASGLIAPMVGHVGDGNFHLGILFDPEDAEESGRAEQLCRQVSLLAMELGGVCSGEHGIGIHKRSLMDSQHGEALAVMRTIKAALDPASIMNPGKLLPPEGTGQFD